MLLVVHGKPVAGLVTLRVPVIVTVYTPRSTEPHYLSSNKFEVASIVIQAGLATITEFFSN